MIMSINSPDPDNLDDNDATSQDDESLPQEQANQVASDDSLLDQHLTNEASFEKYFTLDQAAGLISQVRASIEEAHRELDAAKDDIILFKRILVTHKRSGQEPSDEQLEHLTMRYQQIEEVYAKWIQHFGEQGIILRDLAQGLIDFPYYSQSLKEEFLLCWKFGEDGLFYFHPIETGFGGRQPISLLPE